ncbi:MAG TPA: DUF2130 domain-containing protein, partial [Candidatus Saccharimonadales bacterium]|nr:DUF2130 domain-containing protein [Candidatus Saccharimonadales bacterium]
MDSIICPKCGERVEVSKALKHEIEDKIRTEEKLKAKEEFEKEKIKTEKILEEKLRLEFATEQKTAAQTAQNALKKQKELEEKLERTEKEAKEKEEKIRMDAFKEVSDKARLEKLEFEKKISDMQKALEVAQRKGKQGSQQLQGDVLEQDLEQRLREAFPYDVFKPVPTGIRGGDIIQEIRNKFGNV